MGEQKHRNKQCGYDPGASSDLLEIATEHADNNVGDQTERNAVGAVVGKRHHGQGQKCGDCNPKVVPVHVLYRAHHQEADINQCSGSGAAGNQLSDGAEEHCHKEEQSAEYGGKSGTAAGSNTCIYFAEGGYCGGAIEGADGCGNCIGEHASIHVQGITVLIQQTSALAGGIEGAEGVKHVDHAKSQCGRKNGEDQICTAMGLRVSREVKTVFQDSKRD